MCRTNLAERLVDGLDGGGRQIADDTIDVLDTFDRGDRTDRLAATRHSLCASCDRLLKSNVLANRPGIERTHNGRKVEIVGVLEDVLLLTIEELRRLVLDHLQELRV